MKYFAYGSNMNHKQMKERCPESHFLGSAKLVNYKLVFDGHSSIWDGAVANIVESKNDYVLGGLFEITESDFDSLDRSEGYSSKIYNRKYFSVIPNKNKIDNVISYFRIGKTPGKPSEKYKEQILQGVKDCGLPEDYINNIFK
jgi:gamma-glutamylcyclotransferase (GGCT)/AIG2-like uncharacterized protein YtfP